MSPPVPPLTDPLLMLKQLRLHASQPPFKRLDCLLALHQVGLQLLCLHLKPRHLQANKAEQNRARNNTATAVCRVVTPLLKQRTQLFYSIIRTAIRSTHTMDHQKQPYLLCVCVADDAVRKLQLLVRL